MRSQIYVPTWTCLAHSSMCAQCLRSIDRKQCHCLGIVFITNINYVIIPLSVYLPGTAKCLIFEISYSRQVGKEKERESKSE